MNSSRLISILIKCLGYLCWQRQRRKKCIVHRGATISKTSKTLVLPIFCGYKKPKYVCLFVTGVWLFVTCLTNRIFLWRVPWNPSPPPHCLGVLFRANLIHWKICNRIVLPCYLSTPCHGGIVKTKNICNRPVKTLVLAYILWL